MQDARRRTFLKTLGISALTAGLTPLMPSLKRVNAEEVDWFQGINRVKDPPMNLTPKEKGHAPFVQVPDGIKSGEPFNLAIQIGETLHPMTANHFIQWIEVYLGTDMVARVEFSPLCPQAKTTIPMVLKEASTLRILSRCNLHGIWETARRIAV